MRIFIFLFFAIKTYSQPVHEFSTWLNEEQKPDLSLFCSVKRMVLMIFFTIFAKYQGQYK